MKELLFGTAGIPNSTIEYNTINGLKRLKELELNAMELEFVRNVFLTENSAKLVKSESEKQNIVLTCHASYFINLNANEQKKLDASKKRIISAAKIANYAGVYSLCFHPGFYLGQESEKAYQNIKNNLKKVVRDIQDEGIKIWIRPETTGKATQFGSLTELIKISTEIEQVMPCIDFAHLHARSVGKYNTYNEFREVLELVEKNLGKEGLYNMHIHLAGIKYTTKGERKHLNLSESDFNYSELVKVWKEFKIKGIVICESPNIEEDALLLKKEYKK